jgi:hypothetical protein
VPGDNSGLHYYIELGSGLGDILNQLCLGGTWNILRDLEPGDTADVVLITHNPYAQELFAHHPKRAQITVRNLGFWGGDDDRAMRERHGLPPYGPWLSLEPKDLKFEFYTSPEN